MERLKLKLHFESRRCMLGVGMRRHCRGKLGRGRGIRGR